MQRGKDRYEEQGAIFALQADESISPCEVEPSFPIMIGIMAARAARNAPERDFHER